MLFEIAMPYRAIILKSIICLSLKKQTNLPIKKAWLIHKMLFNKLSLQILILAMSRFEFSETFQ